MRHLRLSPWLPLLLAGCAPAIQSGPSAGADLAITNIAVVDVERGSIAPNRTVLITGNRIVAVTPARTGLAGATRRVDGTGKYLIPGLWDMHAHLHGSGNPAGIELPLFVAHGVTGVRIMGADRPSVNPARTPGLDQHRALQAQIAAGTLPASRGTVTLDGRPIHELDRMAVARRLGVVPQGAGLPFAMRVEEVVGLGRLPHEDPFRGHRPADRAAVAAAIERVGLSDHVGRDARELSLGERQLVLVAMAIAQGAGILLLDEPTVHLDLRHQIDVLTLLRDLNERDGVAIIAVLHDIGLAARYFPRLVLLDRGRIVADGAPEAALAPELVTGVFGVDPSLVRLPAPVHP